MPSFLISIFEPLRAFDNWFEQPTVYFRYKLIIASLVVIGIVIVIIKLREK